MSSSAWWWPTAGSSRRPPSSGCPWSDLHFSLLPRWRGAAPVERAILEDDAETGVCLMAVEASLDTGGIYAEAATAIDPEETADELRSRLVTLGCGLLEEHLGRGRSGCQCLGTRSAHPPTWRRSSPGSWRSTWDQPAAADPPRRPVGSGLDLFPATPARGPGGGRGSSGGRAGRPGRGARDAPGHRGVAGGGSRCAWSPCARRGGGPWMSPSESIRGVRPAPREVFGR